MNEAAIKIEMRLAVLELMVSSLLTAYCVQVNDDDPSAALKTLTKTTTEGARKLTFPHLNDPALSDLYSAELEGALTRLTDQATYQISVILKARGGA
jgi:hypothetical protein